MMPENVDRMLPELRPFADDMSRYVIMLLKGRTFPSVDLTDDHVLLASRLYTWLCKKGLNAAAPDIARTVNDMGLKVATTIEWAVTTPRKYSEWKIRGTIDDLIRSHTAYCKSHDTGDASERGSRLGVICETPDARLVQLFYPESQHAEGMVQNTCLSWPAWRNVYAEATKMRETPGGNDRPRYEIYSLRLSRDIDEGGAALHAGDSLCTLELHTDSCTLLQAEMRAVGRGAARVRFFPVADGFSYKTLFQMRDILAQTYPPGTPWPVRFDHMPALSYAIAHGRAITADGSVVPYEPKRLHEYVCVRDISVTPEMSLEDVRNASRVAGTLDMTRATPEQRAVIEFVAIDLVDNALGVIRYPSLRYVGSSILLEHARRAYFPELGRIVMLEGGKLETIESPSLQYSKTRLRWKVPDACTNRFANCNGTITDINKDD